VETTVNASIERVWACWTTSADIVKWNAASDDWHTTAATVDLRVGGQFTSRMEAKDGSIGFDFAGEYTRIEAPRLIEAVFGGRALRVEFTLVAGGVLVRETFEAEDTHPVEMQKAGWQAILDRFKRHVEGTAG
jgi:uncharacterized protein YndB with AHSA1/START domain